MPLNVVGNVHDWKAKIWRWTYHVENTNQEERDTDRTRLALTYFRFLFNRVSFVDKDFMIVHNVAKRQFGISISERLYLFSRTPSGAPNGSPALTYKWTTQLLKEIAPPWPLDLSEGHGGGPGVVGDEQHWEVQQITHGTSWPSPVNHLNCWRPLVIHIYTLSTHFISKTINGIISTPFGLWFHSFDLIPVIRGTVDKYTIWSRTMAYLNHI